MLAFIAYDNILTVEEDDLDCLSVEALLAELLLEELAVARATDGEEAND